MLETMGHRIARSYNKDGKQEEVFVDPASIMLYVSIVTEVIKIAKRCKEAREIPDTAQEPNRFEKSTLKRVVRRKLGWIKYLSEGADLVQSVLEVGRGSTVGEIEELYNEIK